MDQSNQSQPVPETKKIHRAWSLYLLRVGGIPIYLHFTFIILLIFVGMSQVLVGRQVLGGLLFVIGIFTSVALHELGHALMARRFGIQTEDIVLYPIGGVARLRSMGEGFQEFWIAIAGPAVNVVIAGVLYLILVATGRYVPLGEVAAAESAGTRGTLQVGFWQQIMFVNIVLLVFNLIPAFPMDGGRVLRAILARKLTKERATSIAAKVGQGLAIMFILGGLFQPNPFLAFIGFFVFIAAGQEYAATRSAALMAGRRVRDAMITHFEILSHGDSLGHAAELLPSTSQQDFPVLSGGAVLGVLSRTALIQGLATHGRDHYVAEVMQREFPRVSPGEDLQKSFEMMNDNKGLPVLVMEGDRLVGYINQDNLMEYLLIAQTRQREAAMAARAPM